MLVFMLNFCLPHLALAKNIEVMPISQLPLEAGRTEVIKKIPTLPGLPIIEIKDPRWTVNIAVSAYNSLPGQTDSTPCITASNLDVCERFEKLGEEDVIATNFWRLPFGTKVRFPDLFGDKIFTIEDRMNRRYNQTADIWMEEYSDAKKFGRKWTQMEIL